MMDVVRVWTAHHLDVYKPKRTLDIGAYDVNGCMRQETERHGQYVGLDMREGPNVDVIANGHYLPFDDASFDCVLCLETLEHDDSPTQTLDEIYRILKPNGIVIVTVPGIGFPKHDYPNDYWRVTEDGMKVWLRRFRDVQTYEITSANEWNVQATAVK